ncbi:MAG: type II toxin-antitoxin system VapC family toxin [Candidatus Xenobia bacterium]
MKRVFVDTSGFLAFMSADDPHHQASRDCFQRSQQHKWSLVTTSYVVHETWALLQARLGWRALDLWLDKVLVLCRVEWITESLHALGAARCRQARERRLSLTDCVSFEIMQQQGIEEVIAWDEDFARQGFRLP